MLYGFGVLDFIQAFVQFDCAFCDKCLWRANKKKDVRSNCTLIEC